ncbi:MAG: hypothetical protein L3K19_03070 [Thermoplasmata archaeon]|nr:hypothetical protein [Thermoplasmata archaeon]
MPISTFERYGLTSNPFRELASESLQDIGVYHVNLDIDQNLQAIRDEIWERENRVVVAIVGSHGTGKTERLLLTAAEARERKTFTVYFDVTSQTNWILRGLAGEILKAAKLAGVPKGFSYPAWFREVTALQKVSDEKYDPIQAGKTIGLALNENAPAVLLLNDLHNLSKTPELDAFGKTLQEVFDSIKPGVLVMFGCYQGYLDWIIKNRPALASRINRTFFVPKMTADEAALLLAKKLLGKRVVEEIDPLYPFDKEAVAIIAEAAGGNPRRILEIADLSIEYGVEHRAYRVDGEIVRSALAARKSERPSGEGTEENMVPTSGGTAPGPASTPPPARRSFLRRTSQSPTSARGSTGTTAESDG